MARPCVSFKYSAENEWGFCGWAHLDGGMGADGDICRRVTLRRCQFLHLCFLTCLNLRERQLFAKEEFSLRSWENACPRTAPEQWAVLMAWAQCAWLCLWELRSFEVPVGNERLGGPLPAHCSRGHVGNLSSIHPLCPASWLGCDYWAVSQLLVVIAMPAPWALRCTLDTAGTVFSNIIICLLDQCGEHGR